MVTVMMMMMIPIPMVKTSESSEWMDSFRYERCSRENGSTIHVYLKPVQQKILLLTEQS